jgi:hypothetical protein
VSTTQSESRLGRRYIATDNAGAIAALCGEGYPVPHGVIYVTVERDYPDHEKVQVRPDGLWLTYAELEQWFRPTGAMDG